jgi:general stress protein YciG
MDPEEQREISRKGGRASHGGTESGNGGRRGQAGNEDLEEDEGGNMRGGSSEQHARAGSQSHKGR